MEGSTHSSGTEAGITTTTKPAMPRDTILPEATPSSVPFEHLQIAEKHTTDQPLQDELTDDDPYNGRSKSKVAVIMLALCTAVFLGTLDSTIVTTALPTITEHFNSASGYTWIGSAFLLANASTIPSWGKASDIFGRKPMLLLANVVFMIGSLVAALSNSVGMLVAARAVQGLGSGGLVIVNITIGDLFSLRTIAVFYGILGGVWASASSIGPIIGGLLTQGASWRWCFWINLPLDGLAFIVLFFCLDIESPKTPLIEGLKAIDWIGSFLVIGATLMFLFGIQYGGETYPWNLAIVICLIIFGLLTFALFLLYECKVPKYPIMDLGFLNSRTNIATLSTAFIHGLVFISGTYYLPLYFQAVRGATPIFSGIYLLPTALAASASSFAAGVFVRNYGTYLPPIYTGFLIMTVGFGLFVDLDVHSTWAKLVLYQIIAGVGFGALFQAPFIALQAHIHPRDIGVATTTLGFTRQMATSISVVMGQAVYQNAMTVRTAELSTSLGPELAVKFSGGGVVANAGVIDALPGYQREVVRNVLAGSLQPMWVMYTVFSFVGLLAALCIQKKVLSVRHEEMVMGLAVERQNAVERAAEREVKRAGKMAGRAVV